MTIEEKNKIKKYLNYINKHYHISLPMEGFTSDIERFSESKDSVEGAVNYQNIYKKYLKTVSAQAFHKYISFENPLEDMKVELSTIGDIFDVYEIIMLKIFQMDSFKQCNKLPQREMLYAGLSGSSYTEQIKPDDIPMTAYMEYKTWHTDGFTSEELSEVLRTFPKRIEESKGDERIVKAAALLFEEGLEEMKKCSFFSKKRRQYKKLVNAVDKKITLILGKTKKDSFYYRQSLVNAPGNYTQGVEYFIHNINQNDILERNKNYYENSANFSFMMSDFDHKLEEDVIHHNIFQNFQNETIKITP